MDHLSDIAVFIQVVDCGSFTAAAERLDLSRPVVSKYITRLEDRLGARLLNRTTRRLSLTEAGRVLYQGSQRGLEEIEMAQAAVSEFQQAPRGTLRINVPMSFGIRHIAPALADFQVQFPDLIIDMSLDDRQVDLINQGFDMAIRIADLPDTSLVASRLAPCHHVVCASADYIKKNGLPKNPHDLQHHHILTYRYQDSPDAWQFTAANGRKLSVDVGGSIRMNNSLAMREAVLKGAGIMLTPTFVVGDDINSGRMVALLQDYQAKTVNIYAVYPERRYLSPKVRMFIDFLKQRISDPPYWD